MRLLGLTMLPVAAVLFAVGLMDSHHPAFAYVACAIPFAVYCQVANGIFLLHNDIRTTVIAGAIPTFGVAAFTIPALLVFHGGLTAVLAIWAVMFAAAGCYAMVRLNRYLPALTFGEGWELVREQAWFDLKSGSTSLASFLNLRIDVFVVSIMLDARTLGIYTLAVASGELMWQVSRPLTWAASGRIATADRDRGIALTAAVTRNILAVECILGIVIFALAPIAVRLVYGPAYAKSGSIVRWLLPGLVLYAAQAPLAYFVTVKEGKPMSTLAIQIASVVVCAIISALTIQRLNIVGAALATTATYCCSAVACSVLFARFTSLPFSAFTLLQREDIDRFRRLLERLSPTRRALPKHLEAES